LELQIFFNEPTKQEVRMARLIRPVIAAMALSLTLLAPNSLAIPIVTIYTSEAELEAVLPPGSEPEDFLVGAAEFGDLGPGGTDLDFNVTYLGTGSIIQVPDDALPGCSGVASECLWSTTGPISFLLDSGTANAFVISYLELAQGQAAPFLRMTLTDDTVFDVGPLIGGPFEKPGELFLAFTSTEPFKAVSLTMPDSDPLNTQFVAFAKIEPLPEPSTFLLMATGLLGLLRFGNSRASRSKSVHNNP
jgi:hypothetical protein